MDMFNNPARAGNDRWGPHSDFMQFTCGASIDSTGAIQFGWGVASCTPLGGGLYQVTHVPFDTDGATLVKLAFALVTGTDLFYVISNMSGVATVIFNTLNAAGVGTNFAASSQLHILIIGRRENPAKNASGMPAIMGSFKNIGFNWGRAGF